MIVQPEPHCRHLPREISRLHADIYKVHLRLSVVSPSDYHSTWEMLALYPVTNLTFLSQRAAVFRLTAIMIAVKVGF